MEWVLSVSIGVGLSAACGFRVFVPLFFMSIAQASGHLHLSEGWEWVGSTPAIVCFATATVLEIAAYYIPWVDNLLDTIAGPAAIIAGIIVTGAVMEDCSPLMRWSLATIGGGGSAAAVKTTSSGLRAVSSVTTGGLGNWLVSTGELFLAAATAILAVVLPLLCITLLLIGGFYLMTRLIRGRSLLAPVHAGVSGIPERD